MGDVAKQVTLRFLKHFDVLDSLWIERHLDRAAGASSQRVVDISTVVTHTQPTFRWIRPVRGLELVTEAGTLIAMDGEREVRAPHANSVMVMPVPHPKVGQTAVRIGRFRAG